MDQSNGKIMSKENSLTPPVTLAPYQCLQPRQVDEAISRKAVQQLKTIAQRTTTASETEYINKSLCRTFERKVQSEQADESALTSPPSKKGFCGSLITMVNIGDFVVVSPDLSTGHKSFGGKGWVVGIKKEHLQSFYDVQFIESESQKFERNIPISRLTVSTPPQQSSQLKKGRMEMRIHKPNAKNGKKHRYYNPKIL